jgi:signal peptidase I
LTLALFGCGTCMLVGFGGRVFAEVVPVRDNAMAPSLEPGSDALVMHAIVWTQSPFRSQITQVRPDEGEATFRRVIGEPGDRIEVREGVAFVNGEQSDPAINRRGTGPDFGPITLGSDEFFVLADDREQVDSRTWGPLKRDQIFGEPMFVREPGEESFLSSSPIDRGLDPEWLRKARAADATAEAQKP